MEPATTPLQLPILLLPSSSTSSTSPPPSQQQVEKRYHAKRPHRKSRKGCRNCKARKVKCDEKRPSCRSCTARNEACVYPVLPSKTTDSPTSSETASVIPTSSQASSSTQISTRTSPICTQRVVREPLFIPKGRDEADMRLLWFYTNTTFNCFSSGPWEERNVERVLQVDVVQHAFSSPFLMDCLLGLSAMHINKLGYHDIQVPPSKELLYRAKAYEGFRKAVELADPKTFPALLACSLLLCGLSTYAFRADESRPLYILDWITLWRGIGAVIDIAGRQNLASSGLLALVIRPEIDMEKSTLHIPSNLVFMLASIKEDDPDYEYLEAYHLALKVLGSLYRELMNGLGPMMMLRIATYFTFIQQEFHEAARKRRPRALIILAHYLVFTNFHDQNSWWMDGIAKREIPNIYAYLRPEWRPFLEVPMATVNMQSTVEMARLLLNNPYWEPEPPVIKRESSPQVVLEDLSPSPPGVVPSAPDRFDMGPLGVECIKMERDMIINELTEEQD